MSSDLPGSARRGSYDVCQHDVLSDDGPDEVVFNGTLEECRLAAIVTPGRPDFWNAPKGVCDTCRDRDRASQGEVVRLFTPAPAQLPGQTDDGSLRCRTT